MAGSHGGKRKNVTTGRIDSFFQAAAPPNPPVAAAVEQPATTAPAQQQARQQVLLNTRPQAIGKKDQNGGKGKGKTSQHGGTRPGSGPKTNSQRHGAPRRDTARIDVMFPVSGASVVAQSQPVVAHTQATAIEEPPPTTTLAWQQEARQQVLLNTGVGITDETLKKTGKKGQNRRSGLLKECLDNIDSKYQQIAIKRVQEGQLWDHPKTILYSQNGIDMRKSWKEFHRLSIFNWFPFELIPNFKPLCGTCGTSNRMKKTGLNHPPRLVFGEHENYILNAPQRLCCSHCKETAAIQKANKVPKKDRAQYYWLTTDKCILEQIACEEPGIYEEFPCSLSAKSGLDKTCLGNIIDSAVKGSGPAAAAESIERKHAARWQAKETKWAAHLRRRRGSPLLLDEKIPVTEVEKCPEYKSKEMGGVLPSPSYLIHMFCCYVEKLRKELDGECVKRGLTSQFFTLDASFKVPKWMMKWGDTKLFEVLESGMNEYGEIVAQHFESSDNHRQLRPVLEMLHAQGLDPSVVTSDVPSRDKALIESIFPKTTEGVCGIDLSAENVDGLALLPLSRGQIQYVDKLKSARAALHILSEALDAAASEDEKVVSFDPEWPVFDGGKRQGRISVISLASPVTQDVIVIHLARMQSIATLLGQLQSLFSRKDVAFVGRMISNDFSKFNRDFPQHAVTVQNVIDVGVMAIHRGIVTNKMGESGLQPLTKTTLNYFLPKPAHIRVGDVFDDQSEMTDEVKLYCARDAKAGMLLYQEYVKIPDLTVRCFNEQVEIGTVVDIMPSALTSVEPIARGVVIQNNGLVRHGGLKLTKTRFLIQVTAVHNSDAAVHFPYTEKEGCKCGRTEHGKIRDVCDIKCLRNFGDTPFTMIESYHRLRRVPDEVQADVASVGESSPNVSSVGSAKHTNQQDKDTNARDDDHDSDDDSHDDESSCKSDDDNDDEEGDDNDEHLWHDLGLTKEQMDHLDAGLDADDNNDDEDYDDSYVCPQLEFDAEVDGIHSESYTPEQAAYLDGLSETVANLLKHADELAAEGDMDEAIWVLTRILGDAFHIMDRIKVPTQHDFKAAYFRALRAAVFIMDSGDLARVKRVLEASGRKLSHVMAFNFSYIALRVKRRIPPPKILYRRVKAVFDFFKDKVDSQTNQPLFNDLARKKADLVLLAIRQGFISDPPGIEFYTRKTDKYGKPMVDRDGLWLFRCFRGTNLLESMHQTLTISIGHTRAGPRYSDNLLAVVRHRFNWRASERNRPSFPQVRHYQSWSIDMINELYEEVFGHPKYAQWVPHNDIAESLKPSFGIVPLTAPSLTVQQQQQQVSINQPVKLTASLRYLAARQGTGIPYTPVKTKEERALFTRLIKEALRNGSSMTATSTFEEMEKAWGTCARGGTNGIYGKYAEHLLLYYRKWRKKQSRWDAVNATMASTLTDALEYTAQTGISVGVSTPVGIDGDTEPCPECATDDGIAADAANVGDATFDANANDDDMVTDTVNNSSVVNAVAFGAAPLASVQRQYRHHQAALVQVPNFPTLVHGYIPQQWQPVPALHSLPPLTPFRMSQPFSPPALGLVLQNHAANISATEGSVPTALGVRNKKSRRRCKVKNCKNPSNCAGAWDRRNCGKQRVVRRVAPYTRQCRTPGCPDPQNCNGHNKQSRCMGKYRR